MPPTDDMTGLAMAKLTRVLGEKSASRVFEETAREAHLETLRSAQDLYVFAEHLAKRGGIEAAVAGLLSVAAVLRGATER